ncbi:two-pore potassium channel 1-like [Silene latifolia]|uniref:two-pore potassium channel 1-like n=1 Tax=Silene latifolia TaxID=37657 RepID=UPI003D7782CF
MADNNFLKETLLPGCFDPRLERQRKDAVRKRRFRRAKSAPLLENVPEEVNEIACARNPESPFWNVNPNLIKVAAFLLAYLGVGVLCFYAVRHHITGAKTNGIVDALYLCVVTMTTVGYGDLVPQSVLAKLLACAFVFTGVALVGLILSKGADYLVEKQEKMLVKAYHMSKDSKEFGPSDIIREIETNKARYKCVLVFLILLVLIITGTLFLTFFEKLDFVDAFYCVCCTVTTLGYGDHSFSTEGGRLFAVVWILMSTICLAQFFLYVAELNTENRRKDLVERVLHRRMTSLDLEAADIDDDGVVDAAEFALYKLKEMGKITEEDLSLVFEEFEDLDVDQSGTLSASDINLAQSYPEGTKASANKERS